MVLPLAGHHSAVVGPRGAPKHMMSKIRKRMMRRERIIKVRMTKMMIQKKQ